jgi:hypothetical protein
MSPRRTTPRSQAERARFARRLTNGAALLIVGLAAGVLAFDNPKNNQEDQSSGKGAAPKVAHVLRHGPALPKPQVDQLELETGEIVIDHKFPSTNPAAVMKVVAHELAVNEKDGGCEKHGYVVPGVPTYTSVGTRQYELGFYYDASRKDLNSVMGIENVPAGTTTEDDLFYAVYDGHRFNLVAHLADIADDPGQYNVTLSLPKAIPTPEYPHCP